MDYGQTLSMVKMDGMSELSKQMSLWEHFERLREEKILKMCNYYDTVKLRS